MNSSIQSLKFSRRLIHRKVRYAGLSPAANRAASIETELIARISARLFPRPGRPAISGEFCGNHRPAGINRLALRHTCALEEMPAPQLSSPTPSATIRNFKLRPILMIAVTIAVSSGVLLIWRTNDWSILSASNRKFSQIAEARVAGAEIVHSYLHAFRPQRFRTDAVDSARFIRTFR